MALGHNPTIVASGLTYYMDPANIRSYPGTGTTAKNLPNSNQYIGTMNNSVVYSSSNNGIFQFDGIDDDISLSSNISLTVPFSIDFWAFSSTATSGVKSPLGDSATSGIGLDLYMVWGTSPYYYFFTSNTDATRTSLTGSNISNGWHHIVIVCDSGARYLYIDGAVNVQDAKTANNNGIINRIGTGGTPATYYWPGSIGPVKYYNIALSATQILQNFNALRGRYSI